MQDINITFHLETERKLKELERKMDKILELLEGINKNLKEKK